MDSGTGGATPPRRRVIAALLLVGVVGAGFGIWRLGVWWFGQPEQLLDIGDARSHRLLSADEEDLARARREVEALRLGAADPRAVAAAEASLRTREASHAAEVGAWEAQVRQARRGELAYAAIGALVGGYGLWAGGRLLRARRAARPGSAPAG